MGRFIRALFRRGEELSEELDLTEAGEPREPLPHAEISEKERQEAVRRRQRELREKGQR